MSLCNLKLRIIWVCVVEDKGFYFWFIVKIIIKFFNKLVKYSGYSFIVRIL